MKFIDTARAAFIAVVLAPFALAQDFGGQGFSGQGPRDDAPGAIVVTPEQERAVERGLLWLAEHQSADGSWIAKIGFKLNNDFRDTADDKGHLGVTSLAGISRVGSRRGSSAGGRGAGFGASSTLRVGSSGRLGSSARLGGSSTRGGGGATGVWRPCGTPAR